MAHSQSVSPSAKDSQPSTMEQSKAIVPSNAPEGNTTTIGRIVAFWKRISTRNQDRSQSPEPVVRSMDLLIMQAQVESCARTVFQVLQKCKVDGDKQNSS